MASLIAPPVFDNAIPTMWYEMLYNNDNYSPTHVHIQQMLNTCILAQGKIAQFQIISWYNHLNNFFLPSKFQ